MPRLVNYLHLKARRHYDHVELALLQSVYELALETLRIDEESLERERVASLIFQIADEVSDPNEILARTLTLFSKSR